MTEPSTATLAIPTADSPRTPPWRRLLKMPLAVVSIAILALLTIAAVAAPLIANFPPQFADLGNPIAPPSGEHLLGTDSAGRDNFSRLVWGAQTTLIGVLIVTITAMVVGILTGLLAGYYGGVWDEIGTWGSNVLLALPGMIVLLTVRAAVGPSLVLTMVALGLMVSPSYFRLTRAVVQGVRRELYVDAAVVSGLSDAAILGRHVLTAVRAPLVIHTANVGAIAIGVQASLDFLGLGNPNTVTWGGMLADGFTTIYQTLANITWPALAIGLVTAAFALLGNSLRDVLEDAAPSSSPRRRRRAEVKDEEPLSKRDLPEPTGSRLLEVRGLEIAYPQGELTATVVRDVSFTVDRGEVVGLVGESGSGKSQSAFAVLGLLPPNAVVAAGSIVFDGDWLLEPGESSVSPKRYRELRGAKIAYIPQDPMSNLDPTFTIGYQLMRPMQKVLGLSKHEARAKALDLLTSVGIPDPDSMMRSRAHEISGGMAQRVLIAGAISCDPDLLIADEPTTALDVTVQAEVLDVLRGLQRRRNMGMLMITHNFGVVADICDRVVVMNAGRVVEDGDVRDIMKRPQRAYTQMLLSSMLSSPHSDVHQKIDSEGE
ncbi:dipeptide/oligopeptide/nickel ABC transporter permease/ATP-binding protein [Pseudoclavibacter sp. RFBB5]|uniref:dipeptide/oligopeptide/nickel ABC transporter permease/ATP-binding protein n=1 Tax=Pseudoclavibacter sp. RFBB5 TaxID=2080574 RepID=UPI000CE77A9C|nr:dipeptide/oligopeptide/nickel ABC transporter permease/ATP-binding protein [Pseudoclavibacter sp. RFBB5]PPG33494.1 ABC transporter [Pseudoclavibacter sp. RFBB5]